jgi:myo-inositol-1(or 4)-monophosphatase
MLLSFNNSFKSHAGGAMRGRGWKYGSGFVDGVFPVLSPMAQDILELLQKGTDVAKVWESLDNIPATHNLWDDILNVAVQLRLNRQWGPIISVGPQTRTPPLFIVS